ncbi:MAG TPA: hypothetical protein VHQ98_04805 [Gaiellaceae bacterium]|nr:hypothetical protein [Gaiellaceae bacterium]
MRARSLLWLGPVVLLVLAARWLTYALAPPSPLTTRFEVSAGGPSLVVVSVVSLALAAVVSVATVWLAALGVRERQRLRPERELPRLRLCRLVVRAVALSVAGSLGFALLESYIHWRAGLGFHGLSCLFGPVHRNALPLLSALGLLAAALAEAAQHIHAWIRATVRALLRPRIAIATPRLPRLSLRHRLSPAPCFARARPRAPPLPA